MKTEPGFPRDAQARREVTNELHHGKLWLGIRVIC